MPISREQYSRKQTLDLRLSIANTIAQYLKGLTMQLDGSQPLQFAEVFDEWPGYENSFVSPAACVLPGQITYSNSRLTPHLLEDTWENVGEAGWGLYVLSDAELDLQLVVRAPTGGERAILIGGLEREFQEPGLLMNHEAGPRYGVILPMPTYYGLDLRLSLQSFETLDDADSAARNQQMAQAVIRAQCYHVKVGPVQPFKVRIVETIV